MDWIRIRSVVNPQLCQEEDRGNNNKDNCNTPVKEADHQPLNNNNNNIVVVEGPVKPKSLDLDTPVKPGN